MSQTHIRAALGRRAKRSAGSGPLGSPLVLLGEALGKDEVDAGAPFVGAAGQFLFEGRDWNGPTRFPGLAHLGFSRSDVRIENVIEIRPPDNSLLRMSPAAVARWQADFWKRAEKWTGANVIAPLGNLALNTLRHRPLPLTKKGKWRVRQGLIDWKDKITNWRGSIFYTTLPNGEKLKVIPAFHPAYVLRAGDYFDVWHDDMQRIIGDAEFPQLAHDPVSEHLVFPSESQAMDFLNEVDRAWQRDRFDACLVADIETVKKRWIDCIGFALDGKRSITFDTTEPWVWRIVARLLAHEIPKGWHYGLFDTYVLRRLKGFLIRRPLFWDSQLMHFILDPRDEHRLAYCASRDLRTVFWKHERDKEDGESTSKVQNKKRRHRYNGKDVCRTAALIQDRYRERLEEAGLLDVYRMQARRLSEACLRISLTGFKVDQAARREMNEREKGIIKKLRADLKAVTGMELIAKDGKGKGFSNPAVARYFYDVLKCKPYRKRGSGARTCDELAIRKLMRKYKKARPAGDLILKVREHAKIKQELRSDLVDDDGRMRSLFTPTAKTARLRAAKTPLGTGVNLQNRDRHSDMRRMYVADPGHALVELDESQAEDRMVDGMSGDADLRRMVGSIKIDRHVLNACRIYKLEYDKLLALYKSGDREANEKRQMGKRVRHATNYGMQGTRMAEVALVESEGSLVLDPDECQEWIETLLAAMPGITKYHEWVIADILNQGFLEDSWGWRIYFKGLRLGKEDYKEGFAWHASGEVAKIMNFLGVLVADKKIQKGAWRGAKIVQQGHDSICLSTPPELAYEIAATLYESLNQKRSYPGAGGEWSLRMPVGVKVGCVWKGKSEKVPAGTHEWKVLPEERDFRIMMKESLEARRRMAA